MKPQFTIYGLLVAALLVAFLASFASLSLYPPQSDPGLHANRMPLREDGGRSIVAELPTPDAKLAFIVKSIVSALGDDCPAFSVQSFAIRQDTGALVVPVEWADPTNPQIKPHEVTFARQSDRVYVGRFPTSEFGQTAPVIIDFSQCRRLMTEDSGNHPIQPSGEVGRFEVEDQPSPPADR